MSVNRFNDQVVIKNSLSLVNNANTTTLGAASSGDNISLVLPGSLPVAGGSALISDVSGNLSFAPVSMPTQYSFSAQNNVSSPADIVALQYTSGFFEVDVSATIVATTNKSQVFKLTGVLSSTTGWNLSTIGVTGDDTGVAITITSGGQLQYTSPNIPGFVSLTFNWVTNTSSTDVSNLASGVNVSRTIPSTSGNLFTVNSASVTDSGTSSSGTLSNFYSSYIGAPVLAASNSGVTTTNAYNLYISGSPAAGTNETISNSYSLGVVGKSTFSDQIISTLATGTAPLSVTSTTNVPNLNASLLGGATFASPGSIGSTTAGSGAFTTLSASGAITGSSTVQGTQLISTVATGTAPLSVTSTTNVPNLNASSLGGATFASPGSIGSTTAGSGAFTTLTASSTITGSSTVQGTRLISTVATGTAPLTVTSTTNVPNLNASSLGGATFAAPGPIGSTTPGSAAFTTVSATGDITGTIGATTPNTGAFTTVNASGAITSTVATGSPPFVVASSTNVPNLNASSLGGATFASPGSIGSTTAGSGAFTTLTASSTITGSSTVQGTRLISTVATGTAPLTVTSTTNVPNLNASSLGGATFAAPGPIGSGTAGTGAFTTLSTSSDISVLNNSSVILNGTTSGSVSIKPNTTGSVWNFVLPSSAGTSGQVLTSAAGSTCTWTTPTTGTVTSVALSVPSFLSVTGSPITSSGTLALSYSGTALPVANGGTGSTTSTGSGSVVLATSPTLVTPVIGDATGSSLSVSGQLTSTVATGTAPLVVSSTTNVANLNASSLGGATFASPGSIGSTTAGSGAFTTLTASSTITGSSTVQGTQLISTVTTGTAPLSVTSTTVVPNLNASFLGGATFASPGSIGSTTAGSGAFTTVSASTSVTISNASAIGVITMSIVQPNLNTGQVNATVLGKAQTTNDSGVIKFSNAGGTGSTSNYLGLGLYNNDDRVKIYPTGVDIVTRVKALYSLDNGYSAPTEQGTYTGWNRSGSSGRTFYGNQPGAGTGGFEFVQFNNSNAVTVVAMTIDASGNVAAAGSGSFTTVTGSSTITGTQLISTVATGTAPLSVTSTTVVPNLNASSLGGATFAAPGSIGSTTAGSGAFTTITASSTITGSSTVQGTRLISTVATGTAPLTVTSTTNVPNLNASTLSGATFAAPGPIGSTTAGSGAFTTLTASSTFSLNTTSAPLKSNIMGSEYVLNTLVVGGSALYPPAVLTSNSTTLSGQVYGNGTYNTSASAVFNGSEDAWNAFDANTSITQWTTPLNRYDGSGNYVSSATTTIDSVSYSGEWLQIQMPSATQLTRYEIYPRSISISRAPSTFYIAGSNDGSTWTMIDSRSSITAYTTSGISFLISNNSTIIPTQAGYTYYRMVVNKTGSAPANGACTVAAWKLYSTDITTANTSGVTFDGKTIIGSRTSTFTGDVTVSGDSYLTNLVGGGTTTLANDTLILGSSTMSSFYIDRNYTGGTVALAYNNVKPTAEYSVLQVYNNATDRTKLLECFSRGSSSGTDRVVITTSLSVSGQITSTLATGTAPFSIASTTNVPNLNASSLNGATFASPGSIGSTTAGSGAFTTVSASSSMSISNTSSIGVVTMSNLLPNLNTGQVNATVLGKAQTTNDSAVIKFENAGGTGSTSNFLGLGLYNNTDRVKIFPTGNVDVVTRVKALYSLDNGYATPTEQGTYSGWNRTVTSGRTYYANQMGGGTGGFEFLQYSNTNTLNVVAMTIDATGNVTAAASFNGTAFNNTSDYRLKENVIDLERGLDTVLQLKPKTYNFIGKDKQEIGFIAHEVQEFVPEIVTGVKDALTPEGEIDSQKIDYAKLVPLLVNAIKEQQHYITSLQDQINTIKERLSV